MFAKPLTRALAIATLVAAAAPAAFAQADSTPLTRADVKEETRAAMVAGHMMPAGDAPWAGEPAAFVSTLTRAQRKAETMAARYSGALPPAGDAAAMASLAPMHSTKTRAERKAETLDAIRHHQVMRAGEAG